MAKSKTVEPLAGPGFEESLGQLEKTVHELEEGRLGLEESLARYEGGVKLLRRCYDLLAGAQRRVELLSGVDAEGNPITRPMEDEPTDGLEAKARRRSKRRTAMVDGEKTAGPGHLGEDDSPSAGIGGVDEGPRLF
ncbi:MAG: exodeoxyribonuclease VII small subunit [Pirellulales bacterium]|nr:exodeoxyribonuclease VII small subunit [Pirellulales bacterium]